MLRIKQGAPDTARARVWPWVAAGARPHCKSAQEKNCACAYADRCPGAVNYIAGAAGGCRRPVFSVPVSGMVSYSAAAGDRNGGMIHCPSHYHGLIITTNSTRVCLASFVTFIIQWNSSNPDTDREKKVRCLHFRGKIACKNCYCKCLSILSGVSLEMEE